MKDLREINGKTLELGNKDYTVLLCPGLTDETDDLGNINYRRQIINIDASLPERPREMLEILLHEVQHGLNERFGLTRLKDEETFTTQQAIALSTVLLRNRWLVDFINLAAKAA